jgi:predicted esterase
MRAILSLAALLAVCGPALPQQQKGRLPGGPGPFAGELRDKQGPLMRCVMNAPSRMPPARTLALLLVHHGMNGNENNYFGGTMECLRRLKLEEEFVVISGKSKNAGWEIDVDGPIQLRVIDWALQTYPIDPRQVYLWGSSNGAGFVGRFGWQNQDKIAACVGYCGGYNFQKPANHDPAAEKQEWYFVHGGNDNPQNSGNACKQLKELGYRYVFRQLDGYGHTDIWDGNGHPDKTVVDAVRDDYVLWLRAIRHKTLDPEKRDKEWLAKFENASTAESLLGSKGTFLNLCRIGGPAAGEAIAMGLRSKNGSARGNAAEACLSMSFGKAACAELVKLVGDDSDRVSQAALRALGAYAAWHYPEAIEALCAVAAGAKDESNKGPTLGERLLALDGLAKAAKLAALGNFEDKKMWWTFVQLLEDDEVRVRAAAFAAIQKAAKDGHGYVPGAAADARKAAAARWAAWCTQKCGPPEK